MTFATRLAEVWDVGKDLDEQTGLRYHQVQPFGKGFGSGGHAGEASPTWNTNPLTRLELDLQPIFEN